MRPAFHFTAHAVERFKQRVAPELSDHQALLALHDAVSLAVRLDERTRTGDAYWRIDRPAMRLVTKPDLNGLVVVTIIDGHTGGEGEALDEVLAAYRRLAAHPEVGTPENLRPCDAEDRKGAGSWAAVETQRLITERRRLEALGGLEMRALAGSAKSESLRGLLREAASMLAEIDARKSAGLLARIDMEFRRTAR
jgi:hypothetical protein